MAYLRNRITLAFLIAGFFIFASFDSAPRSASVRGGFSTAAWGSAAAATRTVDCDRGESLNRALDRLDKRGPHTVNVKGTCAEYVRIRGFEGLTLKGLPGAALVKPANPPPEFVGEDAVLIIESSRSATIDGFKVEAPDVAPPDPGAASCIVIAMASTDIRLRNITTEGGVHGIAVGDNSVVSIANVIGRNPTWAVIGIYNVCRVFIEDCLFEGHTVAGFWNVGIYVTSGSVLSLHCVTIRNTQIGLQVARNAVIDVSDFDVFFPSGGPSDVVIENPLGSNYWGLYVEDGGIATVWTAKLRITNAGGIWGGETAAVGVEGGTFNGNRDNLEISGSRGQGIYATNNSHVTLEGGSVTGGLHNGLVALNHSTVLVGPQGSSNAPTRISGNVRQDVFCDSRSLIAGGANINATKVQCGNLLTGNSEPIP
jgi:hypothetical protein